MSYMKRVALLVLVLTGCEGLDLESSNDDPLLQRPARELTMSISVVNDNDASLRVLLRAAEPPRDWTIDAGPRGMSELRIDCADGEQVCRVFEIHSSRPIVFPDGTTRGEPSGAPDWSRQECTPCGSGNLRLVY